MDPNNIVQTLLASQQLAATQQQRLAGLQLHEQVRCHSRRLPAIAAALPAAANCMIAHGHAFSIARAPPAAPPPPQLKAGEVHASAAVATELLKLHQPAELQVLGYTLLQHLVRGGRGKRCRRTAGQHAYRPPPGALKSRDPN